MNLLKRGSLLLTLFALLITTSYSNACTRVLHVSKDKTLVITGRNMDWFVRYPTTFWKFPRGMKKDGRTKENPAHWVSKYGSLVLVQTAQGQNGATDGMNEKGLVANMLYLAETAYPKRDVNKPGVTTSIYIQYILDNFATVQEVVDALSKDSIQIVPVPIPNINKAPTMHFSISDKNGDSAIIEFINGKTVIHHSEKYDVMTNSPVFEKQLALYEYWDEIGGNTFLPGTRRSADRFVRAKYYNKMLPDSKNYKEMIAGVMSIMRNVSSPFGEPDPNKPNISKTQWRVIDDQSHLVTYFESTVSPNLFWIKMKEFDFSEGSQVKKLEADNDTLCGEVSGKFVKSEPVVYAMPK